MSLETLFHALQLSVNVPTRTLMKKPRQASNAARVGTPVAHVQPRKDAEMSRRLNTLVPLLQLPSELLLAIIHEYVALCRKRTRKQMAAKLYNWIGVTHVCHHLRAVALADPTLWNWVNIAHPHFIQELLVRSQQTPLTYKLGYFPPSEPALAAVRIMLGALDRVESLTYTYSSNHSGRFPDFVSADAQKLRSLTLHNSDVRPAAAAKVPQFFADSLLPSLESLDAQCLPFTSIQAMFRPTLKSLTISICTAPGIASSLLLALADLPLLETLKLHQVLPDSPSHSRATSSAIPIVTLPHLRSLDIGRCGAVECAEFLNHLSFPDNTALSLGLKPTRRTPWCTVVIPAITAKFKDRDAIQTACIHTPFNADLQVALWSRAMDMDEFESEEVAPDVCITMYGHHGGTIECDESLVSLTCDLPLSNIKTLFIGELNPYLKRNSSWIAMFSPMTQTEILGVTGSSVEFISSVFHRPREQKPSSSGGGTALPNLKCLSLRKVTFKEDYEADVVYAYDFIHNLRNCLIIRNERHRRLESLRIRLAVNLAEEDAQLLHDVADRLDWDHKVSTNSLRRKWAANEE